MEVSSTIDAIDALIDETDLLALPGSDVAGLVRVLAPSLRKLFMFTLEVALRGVELNQHNVDQAKDGSAWLASLLDIPVELAGSYLFNLSKMDKHPDVLDEARSGSLSFEKAGLIARTAKGSTWVEEEMMAYAHSDSYESLQRRGLDFIARNEDSEERAGRLRNKQYVRKSADSDGLIDLRGKFLPENAAGFLPKLEAALREAQANTSEDLTFGAATAEAFARNISETGGSKPKGVVTLHIRLVDGLLFPKLAEVPGVGVVPISILNNLAENPVLRLLIEAGNKVLFYSSKKYKPDGPLLQWMKDMAKDRAFGICETPGCMKLATECDHKVARDKRGTNEPANLQYLCDGDHDAKTRKDAPWTAGGIFGKKARAG